MPDDTQLDGLSCPDGLAADSPCFDGHFPGNPIAPGAVLVGHLAALCADLGRTLTHLDRVKFLRPLPPETGFRIEISGRAGAWRADFLDATGCFATARLSLSGEDG